MEIFVTGATGAIGRPLVAALVAAGHRVLAATRRPEDYEGPGTPVPVDLDADGPIDPGGAAARADAAYYLVHALDQPDFEAIDRRRAERFADLWGADRPVVYLGGLGRPGRGSPHLRSRHEIGAILRRRTAAVELRAALVIAPGSLSFQLLARLGRHAGHEREGRREVVEGELAVQPALGQLPAVGGFGDRIGSHGDEPARSGRSQTRGRPVDRYRSAKGPGPNGSANGSGVGASGSSST
jgi:hypothetical protein